LVVDDEEDVRTIVRLMLENDGFEVMDASGGREALQIVSNADNPISILITDVLMPQMNGRDLANRVASIRPGIKVLFISAYSAEILSNYQIDAERTDFLRKPFDKKALLARIDKLLPQRLLNAVVPRDAKQVAEGFGGQAPGQEPSPRSAESTTDA
jgi:two-component system, cell cycle sensor histidine kinase and response regulator CckA